MANTKNKRHPKNKGHWDHRSIEEPQEWEVLAESADYDTLLNALHGALEADLSSKDWSMDTQHKFEETFSSLESLIEMAENG